MLGVGHSALVRLDGYGNNRVNKVLAAMIDFKKYIEFNFQPLDIIGTTNFGTLPRIIWRNTWARKNPLAFFFGRNYRKRAHLSTHTAITCVGKDGRPWVVEMDATKWQTRYIAKKHEEILAPEDYAKIAHSCSHLYEKKRIYSGVRLNKPSKYFAHDIYAPHVCWIGRWPDLDKKRMREGNEWLFERYREGVPYDYKDILGLWQYAKWMKVLGSSNIFVCSELAQKGYEQIELLEKSFVPMTPKDWQKSTLMEEVKV